MASSLRSRLKRLESKYRDRGHRASPQEIETYEVLVADADFLQLTSDWKLASTAEKKDAILGQMLRLGVTILYGETSLVDLSDFAFVPDGWTGVNLTVD